MVKRAGLPIYQKIADDLREGIVAGRYPPGAQLPSAQELRSRWKVTERTVRDALVQLRAEGLVTSQQGRGVFVREPTVPRRLSTDVALYDGWYSMARRHGLAPATTTTVTTGPATDEVAQWLELPTGTEVSIRDRVMQAEGAPPVMLATSYFPMWVVEQAPKLRDPNVSGLPKWLREAFGPTYSEDVIAPRMPTPDEQDRLQLSAGVPVLVIKGGTFDQERRALHFISTVAAGDRIEFGYRYGSVPNGA
ncbi:MAG TPA: GntR family transcriptional regulator [Actinomycetes bacterium]|nr:GntR family transcriptional regulator [Actinomycetes bacterium]